MGAGSSNQKSSSSSSTENFLNSDTFSQAISSMIGNSVSQNNASSASNQRSNTVSQGNTFVAGYQKPFLQDMYEQAQQFANPQAAQATATRLTNSVLPQLQQDFKALGTVDANKVAREQTNALRSGLGDLFSKEINPQIKGNAIGAGGFGGGRQGVAQGVAAGELASAFTQGKADITAAANKLALDRAAQRSALAQGIQTTGMLPQTAGLGVLEQLAGILGPTTVLSRERSKGTSVGKSKSKSTGSSKSTQKSGSQSFSEGTTRGGTISEQESSGKASGWDFRLW